MCNDLQNNIINCSLTMVPYLVSANVHLNRVQKQWDPMNLWVTIQFWNIILHPPYHCYNCVNFNIVMMSDEGLAISALNSSIYVHTLRSFITFLFRHICSPVPMSKSLLYIPHSLIPPLILRMHSSGNSTQSAHNERLVCSIGFGIVLMI